MIERSKKLDEEFVQKLRPDDEDRALNWRDLDEAKAKEIEEMKQNPRP